MYLLINKEKLEIKEAINFKDRLFGLIGKTNITYGMLFPKCNSIHTFFMKENIDVIGLDKNNITIYKYENLPENQIIKIDNKLADTNILELPQGYGKYIRINEKINFKN